MRLHGRTMDAWPYWGLKEPIRGGLVHYSLVKDIEDNNPTILMENLTNQMTHPGQHYSNALIILLRSFLDPLVLVTKSYWKRA